MATGNERSFAAKVSSAVKAAGTGSTDKVSALTSAIGARVRIVTATPDKTYEGTLFTADPKTNLVAINTGPSQITGDYHIIPTSCIQTFTIISLPEPPNNDFQTMTPNIARLDLKALERREAAAVQRVKEKDASRGKGVTSEAQEIFDAIARTLPARWHDTSIIVNDTVRIDSPYGLDDCRAPKEQQNALTRVKRVLENERRKIAERSSSPGARKGG